MRGENPPPPPITFLMVRPLIPFLTPFTHNPLIRSNEGLALETSAIVCFTAFHYPHQHTVDTPV